MALPTGQASLTLQFWNQQTIEDSNTGCWDAAILEISIDGGSTWTQMESELMTDPYHGIVNPSSSPLSGLNAWCGDPQDWLNSIVDLDSYAGQSVQFRFRLGTDSSVGREGWYVDDVVVQSCQPGGEQPNIMVAPDSLSSEQAADTVMTQTLTISNTGTADLNWSINEATDAACTISGDLPWLAADPMVGTTISDTSSLVQVAFDSTDVEPGTYLGSLCVVSNDLDSPNVTIPVTLTVPTVYGVSLSDDMTQSGEPGTIVTYTVSVTNTGNMTDTFTLEINHIWPVSTSLSSITLGAEASGEIWIWVEVPTDMVSGEMDTAVFTGTSQSDTQIFASIMLTTSVADSGFYLYLLVIMKP